MALLIMKATISLDISEALPKKDTAKEFLTEMEGNLKAPTKCMLMSFLLRFFRNTLLTEMLGNSY